MGLGLYRGHMIRDYIGMCGAYIRVFRGYIGRSRGYCGVI